MPFMPGFRGAAGPQFPAVTSSATSAPNASTTTSHTLPSGVQVGDLLVFAYRASGSVTVTTPSGWTLLYSQTLPTNGQRCCVFYKVADGSEGSSVGVTASSSVATASIIYRIVTYQGVPEIAHTSGSSGANVDPPSLSPSWGNKKALWLAMGWDPFGAINGPPTNYSNMLGATSAMKSSERQLAAGSEDPAAYTHTQTTSSWRAATIAIRGANT